MANIRIDNACDDAITVCLDGTEYFVPEDESVTVSAVEKGVHTATVSRPRLIGDSESAEESGDSITSKLAHDEKSQYVQLSSTFTIDVNATKSVWTLKKKVLLAEKNGLDALFSGFDVEISGGRLTGIKDSFATDEVEKKFMKKQLSEAFFPIGIGIIIFTVVGLFALAANIAGAPITLGGREFTYPWTFGLLAIDLGFAIYFFVMLKNIFSAKKKYK